MFNSIKEYKKFKFMEDIIVNGLNETNSSWINDYDKFLYFTNCVQYFIDNNFIGPNELNNINYAFNKAIMMIEDEHTEKRIDKVYEILKKIDSKSNNICELYKKEQKQRNITNIKDDLNIHIKNSIHNDLVVLSLGFDIDGITFLSNMDILDKSEYFTESINVILKECPICFKDNSFYSRIMLAFSFGKTDKEVKSNKKIIKKIKRINK